MKYKYFVSSIKIFENIHINKKAGVSDDRWIRQTHLNYNLDPF